MIDCNKIICNTNCKKTFTSDCIILSGECKELCYVDFCKGTQTLTDFIAGFCQDYLEIRNQLDCMTPYCNNVCTIFLTPITIT